MGDVKLLNKFILDKAAFTRTLRERRSKEGPQCNGRRGSN